MRVRMIKIECGPAGSFQPGDERDVATEHGRALLAAGAAINITPRAPERAVVVPPEVAVTEAAEQAIARPQETRRRGRGR